MMQDISSFGAIVQFVASVTFPAGINLTSFADDGDSFDLPVMQIADGAMSPNGDLVTWSMAKRIDIPLNIIPMSDDDIDLGILFEANRISSGKNNARDIITLAIIYPQGTIFTYQTGRVLSGMPGTGAQNTGRLKSKQYTFMFESRNVIL